MGLRDGQTERDAFVIANWVHTFSPKALVSVAPFYHFNQSDYDSLPTDQPGGHHLAPELELWRARRQTRSWTWAGTASRAGSTRSTSTRTICSA